jgi:predicted dehydrogenase
MTLRAANETTVGLIGAGDVVEQFHLPALAALGSLRVAWVCDRDLPRAARLARAWRIPASFACVEECPDVEAVLVATPVGTRGELVTAALRRGWHCLCEKPFALSLAEHERLVEEAHRRQLVLAAAYLRRFYWSTRQAWQMLEARCLGAVRGVVISDTAPLRKTGVGPQSYRNDPQASGGGVLAETGCHAVDQALYLTSARRVEVAECAQVAELGLEIETRARGWLELPRAERVPFSLTLSGIREVFDGVVVQCAGGQLRLRDDPRAPLEIFARAQDPVRFANPRAAENLALAAFRQEWLHFAAALNGGPGWDYEEETGMLTTELIERCYRLGRPVAQVAGGVR